MQTILLIGAVIECLLLLGITLGGKFTRKVFAVIAAVTAIACGAALLLNHSGSAKTPERDVRSYIYIAAKLIEDERPEDALSALGQITDTEGAQYGSVHLRSLAYHQTGAYSAGIFLLEGREQPELQEIYDACVNKVPVSETTVSRILSAAVDSLKLTPEKEAQYQAEMAIRFLHNPGAASTALAQISSALQENDVETAYRLALDNALNGTPADLILASQMYIQGMDRKFLSEEDAAIDTLLNDVTQTQIVLNRAAASDGTDSTAYSEAYADYQLALQALHEERVRRAINLLQRNAPENDSEYLLAYRLQMASLLHAAGDFDGAKDMVQKVFESTRSGKEQWLGIDCMLLAEAFLDGSGNFENPQFDARYLQLMNNLYQGITDETISTPFYSFLYKTMNELFGGYYIGRPDLTAFPEVRITVSTSAEKALTEENILLSDTKASVSGITIAENEEAALAACLVIDRSGSMSGQSIVDARLAAKNFIMSVDSDVNLALVSFENDARLDCPLVDSPYIVASSVDKLEASGGTNISGGLKLGAAQLQGYNGKRVIILLSDGYDGNSGTIDQTLRELNALDIVVYVIGLPGCDEAYLTKIANETGGSYFPAADSNALNTIYTQIRGILRHSYDVRYTIDNADILDRRISLKLTDSLSEARRDYSVLGDSSSGSAHIFDKQSSDFFQQVGGSMGG